MCILELSKNRMYDFHYNVIMETYGYRNAKLLFTDTDSLMYEITTEDVYNDLYEKKELQLKKNGRSFVVSGTSGSLFCGRTVLSVFSGSQHNP